MPDPTSQVCSFVQSILVLLASSEGLGVTLSLIPVALQDNVQQVRVLQSTLIDSSC